MRIGIVSTSRIIDVFWDALPEMDDIQVTAICCRPQSVTKAQMWAEKYNISEVYTDYAKFLAEGTFDFVYDGTANFMHYQDGMQCLEAGRNLIMEKPFTITAAETADMIKKAKEKNLWLFEAITNWHNPCYNFLKEQLPKLGTLRGGSMYWSMNTPRYKEYLNHNVTPTFDPKMAGGILMDMNSYNIHLAVGLLGAPVGSVYYPHRGWSGIDTGGLAVLQYPKFTVACYAEKGCVGPCGSFIQGDNGYIEVKTWPISCHHAVSEINGVRIEFENPKIHRFALEFNSINEIWASRNRKLQEELLEGTQMVMDVLDPLYKTVLEGCNL